MFKKSLSDEAIYLIKDSGIETLKLGGSKHSGYCRVALLWKQAQKLFDESFPAPMSTIHVSNKSQETYQDLYFRKTRGIQIMLA